MTYCVTAITGTAFLPGRQSGTRKRCRFLRDASCKVTTELMRGIIFY